MKAIRFAALLLCLLLLSACGAAPTGPVTVVTPLEDDVVAEQVALSDGELDFRREWNEIAQGFYGNSMQRPTTSWKTPEHAVMAERSYGEFCDEIQCDLIAVLREAGLPERCVPAEEDFSLGGWMLTEEIGWRPYTTGTSVPRMTLHAGTIFGGEGFRIYEKPVEAQPWMYRTLVVAVNRQGEWIDWGIAPAAWSCEPNSRVGNIPVYLNSAQLSVPANGGWEQEEFFACFNIAGYTYGVLSVDYTQQEFIEVLLAIINHYGAYPEENNMD